MESDGYSYPLDFLITKNRTLINNTMRMLPPHFCLFLLLCLSCTLSEKKVEAVRFNKEAQIETGSHYAGLEFHHSFPVPQRISFYYPVANSLDRLTDYWTRDSTFVMAIGLKENKEAVEWFNEQPFEFGLTPYSVSFFKKSDTKSIRMTWQFCKDKSALVLTTEITNLSEKKKFTLYTGLQTSLRTCHTYALKDRATTTYRAGTIYTQHKDPATQEAQLFVANRGESPTAWSGLTGERGLANKYWWKNADREITNQVTATDSTAAPAARFVYTKELAQGEKMEVIQIIGSCKSGEAEELVSYLKTNFKKEVSKLEDYVLSEVNQNLKLTGDSIIDQSILWAKAILAVNQHYLKGDIVPMPCPAEYNFYFSHDVLLSDLALVKFDPARVKRDLQYILDHSSKDFVIPHACYWKDSKYVTELCTPDDWIHLWFLIASGSYFRHSGDVEFIKKLYPYLKKSLQEATLHVQGNVIAAYRPDWWDFARNFGPRTYMTTLGAKAIQEFSNIARALGDNGQAEKYHLMAADLITGLNTTLWDEDKKYLMNFMSDGTQDQHYYMGSLFAVYFNYLEKNKAEELIATANKNLLKNEVGICTVTPMDFSTPEMIELWKCAGKEAGDPHRYINGGIWPHSNAIYALSLMRLGKKEEAIRFMKKTMTLHGVINSPNGQPAMFEYRNSNSENPTDYGKTDKPQFMWAASWYLYCVYELYGWDNE